MARFEAEENQVGVQKPGFLRKYLIATDRLDKNPVSLLEVRNSRIENLKW